MIKYFPNARKWFIHYLIWLLLPFWNIALFRPISMEFTKAFTVRAVNELIILWFRWDVDMPTTGASSRILQGYWKDWRIPSLDHRYSRERQSNGAHNWQTPCHWSTSERERGRTLVERATNNVFSFITNRLISGAVFLKNPSLRLSICRQLSGSNGEGVVLKWIKGMKLFVSAYLWWCYLHSPPPSSALVFIIFLTIQKFHFGIIFKLWS